MHICNTYRTFCLKKIILEVPNLILKLLNINYLINEAYIISYKNYIDPVSPDLFGEKPGKEIPAFSFTNGADKAEIKGHTTVSLTLAGKKTEFPPDAVADNKELVNIGYVSVRKKHLTTSVVY